MSKLRQIQNAFDGGSVEESAAALQPDRITTDRAQESKCKSQSHYSTTGKTRD
jgi:hypothetical protein